MGEPSRVRVTGPLEPFAAGFIAELAGVWVSAGRGGGAGPGAGASEPLDAGEGTCPRTSCASRSWSGSGGEHLARVASVRGAGMAVVLGYLRGLGVVPARGAAVR